MGVTIEINSIDEMCDLMCNNQLPREPDRIETVAKDCKHKNCVYRGHISPINQSTEECCDYILIEGHSRGCPISECNKYRRGKRKKAHSGSYNFVWKVCDEDEGEEWK